MPWKGENGNQVSPVNSISCYDSEMYPNYTGLVAVGLTILAFFLSVTALRRLSGRQRLIAIVILIVLAIPGVSFSAYYLHYLPESAWYYEFRSWKGTEFCVVPLGAAGGALGTMVRPVLKYLILAGAFLAAYVPFCKPIVLPLPDEAFREVVKDGIWQQSTPSTCGAASTATLLNAYGKQVTEKEVARRAFSYGGGTEAWYLARVVRDEGLNAEFHYETGFVPDFPYPAMVGVKIYGVGHFIAILGREGNSFVVADPLPGKELLTQQQIEERYEFTGFNLRVSPR